MTLSVGFCSHPDHGIEAAELLDRADRALYESKRAGRNRVSCWGPTGRPDLEPAEVNRRVAPRE